MINRSTIIKAAVFIFIVLFIQVAILTVNAKRQTPIMGLRAQGQLVSGMDKNQLADAIRNKLSSTPLILSYQNKKFAIYPRDIGVKVDINGLYDSLNREGRSGRFFQNLIAQDAAILGLKNKPIQATVSNILLTVKILEIKSEIELAATPPTPDFANNFNDILPAKDGIKIKENELANLIATRITDPQWNFLSNYLVIPVEKTASGHKNDNVKQFADLAEKLTQKPISIVSGGENFILSPQDLRALLVIVERPDPQNPGATILALRIDDYKLNKKLDNFALRVEQKTHAEFDDHDARIAIYSQFFSNTRENIVIPTGVAVNFMPENMSLLADSGPLSQPAEKFVYLTFDDGPNAVYHPLILDILKKYNIHGTFFMVGNNAQKYDIITKRTVDDGNVIGDHTLTHVFLPSLNRQEIDHELIATKDILESITGKKITLFRPPYGAINNFVKQGALNDNLKLTLWNVDPRDWTEPSTDELVNRVVQNARSGANILLHSNHLATVKALPTIIEELQKKGYGFRTL